MKKVAIRLFYIFVAAIFGFVIYKFVKYYQHLKSPIIPAIQAIDENAFALIEIKNHTSFFQFIKNNELLNSDSASTKNSNSIILLFEFFSEQSANATAQIQSLYLVFHNYNNQLHYLILFNATNNFQIKTFENFLSEQISTYPATIAERYIASDIKKISLNNSKNQLYFALSKGVFIISAELEICRNAILQTYNENHLLKNKTFVQLQDAAGKNVEANLYINYPNLINLINHQKSDAFKNASNYLNITQWSVFDVSFKESNLALDGISINSKSGNNILNTFANTVGIDNQILKIIPDNTIFYAVFSFQNSQALIENYDITINKNKHIDTSIYSIFNINSSLQICELVCRNYLFDDDSLQRYFIIAAPEINKMLLKINNNNILPLQQPISDSLQDEIYFGNKTINFFKQLPLPTQNKNDSLHYFSIDSYIIFGNNINSLKQFYRKYKYQQLLKNNSSFLQQYEAIPENTNYQFYCDILYWLNIKNDIPKWITNKNTSCIFNFVNHQDYFFSNGKINFSNDNKKKNKYIIFNDSLNDNNPITIFNNQIATIDRFQYLKIFDFKGNLKHTIFIQNADPKSLKLLTFQDKSQYLHCQSKDSLYFISLHANTIIKKTLKHKQHKNSFSFTDNSGQNLYIISDGSINKFELIEEKIVKSVIKLIFPNQSIITIQHFTFDNKDYFLAKDKNNHYYLLQKDSKPMAITVPSETYTFFQQIKNNIPEFVACAKNSEFMQYNFITHKWEQLNKIKETQNISSLVLFDADNNLSSELFITAGKKLFVYNHKGEYLKELSFVDNINISLTLDFKEQEIPKFLLTIRENDFWYIINSQFEVEQSYPVQGNQLLFHSNKNKKTRIIAAGSNIIITEN